MKSKFWTVLSYEFKKIVCKKSFIAVTILGPFILAAIIVLPTLLSMNTASSNNNPVPVGILNDGSNPVASIVEQTITASGWDISSGSSQETLKQDVFAGKINGYLVIESDGKCSYYTEDTGNLYVASFLENVVSNSIITSRLMERGLDPAETFSLMAETPLSMYKLSQKAEEAEETDASSDYLINLLVPMFFAMTIYMAVLLYGQSIGRSVVSEKSSKIVDVLLSSATADDLLFGKIIGVALSGMLQFAIWIGCAILGVQLAGHFMDFSIPVVFAPINFIYLGIFFMLGFLLYGAGYGAIGAASEDEQHMGQLSYPLILFLVIPIIMISSVTQDPDSTMSMILSLFPFTSPIIMLARVVTGSVPIWQSCLSIVILVATIWLFMKVASKIFRVGILMTGKNFKFKDMKDWLLQK